MGAVDVLTRGARRQGDQAVRGDHYVSEENRQALINARQPHQVIELLHGHTPSDWTYDQASAVIAQSRDFLVAQFAASSQPSASST